MSDAIRKLKERARVLLARDRVEDAIEVYEELVTERPDDIALSQKLASLCARTGDRERAIEQYRTVMRAYSDRGEVLKAIAICKIIHDLDPDDAGSAKDLDELHQRQRHATGTTPAMFRTTEYALTRQAYERARIRRRLDEMDAEPLAPEHEHVVDAQRTGAIDLDAVRPVNPNERKAPKRTSSAVMRHITGDLPPPRAIAIHDDPVAFHRLTPIPLFGDLSSEAFLSLTQRMKLRKETMGTEIVTRGEPGRSMFVVIQGRVVVHRMIRGRETTLAILSDGAFFGEMALLGDAPRFASVTAVEDVLVFEIERELVDAIVAEHPSVKQVMEKFHRERMLANLVHLSPIFSVFDDAERETIAASFETRRFATGDVLLEHGCADAGLSVVLAGNCAAYRAVDGREILLGELREGDVFGEISVLWDRETIASVRARSSGMVLHLPRQKLRSLTAARPDFERQLKEIARHRLDRDVELLGAKAPDVEILASTADLELSLPTLDV